MRSLGGLLDFKTEEYVIFYLLSGQGSASPLSCYFGVSVHKEHLSPSSVLYTKSARYGLNILQQSEKKMNREFNLKSKTGMFMSISRSKEFSYDEKNNNKQW